MGAWLDLVFNLTGLYSIGWIVSDWVKKVEWNRRVLLWIGGGMRLYLGRLGMNWDSPWIALGRKSV